MCVRVRVYLYVIIIDGIIGIKIRWILISIVKIVNFSFYEKEKKMVNLNTK